MSVVEICNLALSRLGMALSARLTAAKALGFHNALQAYMTTVAAAV